MIKYNWTVVSQVPFVTLWDVISLFLDKILFSFLFQADSHRLRVWPTHPSRDHLSLHKKSYWFLFLMWIKFSCRSRSEGSDPNSLFTSSRLQRSNCPPPSKNKISEDSSHRSMGPSPVGSCWPTALSHFNKKQSFLIILLDQSPGPNASAFLQISKYYI